MINQIDVNQNKVWIELNDDNAIISEIVESIIMYMILV